MKLIKRLVYKLRGEHSTEQLIEMGMKVGENFNPQHGVILDPSHCWLIEIGNNVTLAPRVHVLCHDASTKNFLGYTQIGRVTIGDNVFIGAESVILPGVKIGSNVIIGANSTVTKDIPDNSVAAGSPAKVICSLGEFLEKRKQKMDKGVIYDSSYTLRDGVTSEKKNKQKEELTDKWGYIE